jgi:hypothetical protein
MLLVLASFFPRRGKRNIVQSSLARLSVEADTSDRHLLSVRLFRLGLQDAAGDVHVVVGRGASGFFFSICSSRRDECTSAASLGDVAKKWCELVFFQIGLVSRGPRPFVGSALLPTVSLSSAPDRYAKARFESSNLVYRWMTTPQIRIAHRARFPPNDKNPNLSLQRT